jgi:hypothetical protein
VVLGVSKVSALKRTTSRQDREGGDNSTDRKSPPDDLRKITLSAASPTISSSRNGESCIR